MSIITTTHLNFRGGPVTFGPVGFRVAAYDVFDSTGGRRHRRDIEETSR
ncbi:MAG TPA: hypothetical protein VH333_15560 [Pseudonocardiaceae bacterium]|jgi:hypothetical protein|nr:hypothetical protein [Pseudonocardiaceae bacterium]